ncbi:MAG: ABC transporter permease [Actinomycetota bacterium]
MTAVHRRRPTLALRVLERNWTINRHYGAVLVGRLLEPFIFLFSIGVGVGVLIDAVELPSGPVSYQTFVAPAMLAGAAMNAAVFATTVDFFSKLKWVRSYDALLASPVRVVDVIWGELLWVLALVGAQSGAFVVAMAALGLIESWWGLLLVPTGMLVAFAFGGVGFLGAAYIRSWFDFEFIGLITYPLFLFSASFFPLSRYPDVLQWVVRATPLYQGVDLARDLALGTVGWTSLLSVAYLLLMGRLGLRLALSRVERRLQP